MLECIQLLSLEKPYESIQEWHATKTSYSFDDEAMEVYYIMQFADDMWIS